MSAARRRYRVLVIDDSEDDRFFLRRSLAALPEVSAYHEVADLDAAREALEVLGRDVGCEDPVVVLLDCYLGTEDFRSAVRGLRPRCPVGAVILGISHMPPAANGEEDPDVRVLEKPITPELLRQALAASPGAN